MIRKMGIGMKLSLCVGGLAALLFAGMIAFFAVKLRDEAKARVYDAVKMEAEAQANMVDAEIEVALDAARTLAQLLGVMDDMPPMDRRARVSGMLKTLVDGNADFLGVWAVYEPNALDGMDGEYAGSGQGNDAKGRFVPYWNRVGGVHLEPCADYEAPGKGDYYHKPLSSGQEVIMDPVVYKVNNVDTLLISLCAPIRSKGKIVGVAGVDIDVKRLQGLVGKINPFNAGYAFLLSNNGTYVAHPKAEYIGKHILDVRKDATARAEAVKNGQSRTEEQVSLATGETSYYYLSPIRVGQTTSPWSIVLTVSLDKLLAHSREVVRLSIVAGGVGIAALLGLVILLSRFIVTRPLAGIVEAARHFAAGDFSRRLEVKSGDEVGQAAENLNAAFDIVVDKAWWYESILDSIPFPVSVTDRDMRWTFINKPAEVVIGKTREQVMGRDCRDWGADICGTDRCGVACLKRGQKETTFTQPGLDRDFKVDSAFLDNKKGERIGHIEVVLDVTEANALRKKAESALREGMLAAAGKLEGIVERITASSEELSAQVEEISKGADMQKERMSETATAMEEMNATVMEVAKNAGQAADGAERAKAKAMAGAGIVTEATASIGEVRTKAQGMAVNLGELGRQAESIGQVMNVINDIADQTNLLALNAAIEAARAGDAGRGFAVVADEVRKLAEKTMGATKEVGDNIRAIQEATRKNIADMQAAAAVVDRATELSGQSGGALSEIVSFVETSADQVRGIASAAEEQSAASEEISRSLDEVNRVAGETADSMEQSAQALTELAHMAAELRRLIEELKGDDSGPRGLPA